MNEEELEIQKVKRKFRWLFVKIVFIVITLILAAQYLSNTGFWIVWIASILYGVLSPTDDLI